MLKYLLIVSILFPFTAKAMEVSIYEFALIVIIQIIFLTAFVLFYSSIMGRSHST